MKRCGSFSLSRKDFPSFGHRQKLFLVFAGVHLLGEASAVIRMLLIILCFSHIAPLGGVSAPIAV
jgi:hypothetical protein